MGIAQRLLGIVSILFCSILFIAFCTSLVSASTLRVPEDYGTIQSAIDVAVDFDTVLINDGTYTGDGNRDIDFLGKAIVVKSINGAASTIIDCQGDVMDPHRGFIFHSREDSLSILEGLTIQNGHAPGDYLAGESNGGGILCDSNSSPIIMNCIIAKNRSFNSGGGIAIFHSSPSIIACILDSNDTWIASGAGIVGLGGGIRCLQSSSRLINCHFIRNRATGGGGLSCRNSDVIVDSCSFNNNIADIFYDREPAGAGIGGGLHLFNSNPELRFCQIFGNRAITIPGPLFEAGQGGGIALLNSSPHIINCNIVYNVAQWLTPTFYGVGVGIYCYDSQPILEQSIIAFNTQGEAIYVDAISSVTAECTNIFGNEYGDWIGSIDTLRNLHNNFSLDPQFCDSYSQDYKISQASPCLETNSLCGLQVGVFGLGCVTTDVGENLDPLFPQSFILYQNYPNPFNATTTISFDSLSKSPFQLSIYNILGEAVYSLNGIAAPGINTFVWNADEFASGIYFYSLKLDAHEQTRKMLLLK